MSLYTNPLGTTLLVSRHPNWDLVDIYADEGISGTSLQHRDDFIKMINDCKDGKIDIIVTKSVARFARNILDCIGYVRQLAAMQQPVGPFAAVLHTFRQTNYALGTSDVASPYKYTLRFHPP